RWRPFLCDFPALPAGLPGNATLQGITHQALLTRSDPGPAGRHEGCNLPSPRDEEGGAAEGRRPPRKVRVTGHSPHSRPVWPSRPHPPSGGRRAPRAVRAAAASPPPRAAGGRCYLLGVSFMCSLCSRAAALLALALPLAAAPKARAASAYGHQAMVYLNTAFNYN